ncbi:hypothetical protein CPC08DRAFT_259859 [Agrocybe pediades]|nr:hypothetical protein CPC08DRAFT_259859 [Agrocybe pediades]
MIISNLMQNLQELKSDIASIFFSFCARLICTYYPHTTSTPFIMPHSPGAALRTSIASSSPSTRCRPLNWSLIGGRRDPESMAVLSVDHARLVRIVKAQDEMIVQGSQRKALGQNRMASSAALSPLCYIMDGS